MIKIDTNQRKRLQEVCNEFDEQAIGSSLLITRVREHRIREVWVGEGALKKLVPVSLPEIENDPKNQHTPIFCGVVLSVGPKDETDLLKGDLVRYTPLSAEEVSSSDGSYSFLRIDQYSLRTFSHNVFTAADDMFCDPPPSDVPVN